MALTKRFVATAIAALVLAACSSSPAAPVRSYPNNHDAITMLASESIAVVLVHTTGQVGVTGQLGTHLTGQTDQTLQTDYNHLYGAVGPLPGPFLNSQEGIEIGKQYILFISYNRGGACLAAAFNFTGINDPVRLVKGAADFGPDSPRGFRLGKRFLTMPTSISYHQLVSRLYPTGGELDATNTGESFCPGP